MKTLNFNQLIIVGNCIKEKDKKELNKIYHKDYYEKNKYKLNKYKKKKYNKFINKYNDIIIIEGKFLIEL